MLNECSASYALTRPGSGGSSRRSTLVVAFADTAVLAVERPLDSAHTTLAAVRRADRQPRLLLSTERLAVQVLDATDQLTALLREYLDSVRFDLADLDEDIADPF